MTVSHAAQPIQTFVQAAITFKSDPSTKLLAHADANMVTSKMGANSHAISAMHHVQPALDLAPIVHPLVKSQIAALVVQENFKTEPNTSVLYVMYPVKPV